MNTEPVVFIVDDDPTLRDALCMLFESVSIRTMTFSSGAELLSSGALLQMRSGCLLVDVRMPGISGMTLLERLRESGIDIPAIMITAYGDIPMAVRAMKLGAVDFITKPFNPQTVLELVQNTLNEHPAPTLPGREPDPQLLERYQTLTPREQQVFEQITAGKSNRMVADALGISVRTAEFHRAGVMRKLQLQNLADLTVARINLQDLIAASTDSDQRL
ncbi:MAG: response regulator [Lamprobacter sp.]|uniref:response regulator transcription factor n=1 Tax=Lamprobacter sp. TaxID=3100796 RepID=UPI002B258306|nr:response regulator [Lamprobacter sp.]MEA3641457.1 response regulator [Lamprobacter sp.]